MRSVAWSSFNKPVQLTSHTMVLTSGFVYGPDRARIRQRVIDGTSRKTVYYVGGVLGSLRSPAFGSERHVKDHADDEEIHYIRAGGTVDHSVITRHGHFHDVAYHELTILDDRLLNGGTHSENR